MYPESMHAFDSVKEKPFHLKGERLDDAVEMPLLFNSCRHCFHILWSSVIWDGYVDEMASSIAGDVMAKVLVNLFPVFR